MQRTLDAFAVRHFLQQHRTDGPRNLERVINRIVILLEMACDSSQR